MNEECSKCGKKAEDGHYKFIKIEDAKMSLGDKF